MVLFLRGKPGSTFFQIESVESTRLVKVVRSL
jgi:hypothetical protein